MGWQNLEQEKKGVAIDKVSEISKEQGVQSQTSLKSDEKNWNIAEPLVKTVEKEIRSDETHATETTISPTVNNSNEEQIIQQKVSAGEVTYDAVLSHFNEVLKRYEVIQKTLKEYQVKPQSKDSLNILSNQIGREIHNLDFNVRSQFMSALEGSESEIANILKDISGDVLKAAEKSQNIEKELEDFATDRSTARGARN